MPRKRPADKQYVMTIRLSPALRKKCKTAAEERGMLLSQFLRFAAALVADVPAAAALYAARQKRRTATPLRRDGVSLLEGKI